MPGIGLGTGIGLVGGRGFLPTDINGLELWLRPEDLINPNLFQYTEDFSNAVWSAVNTTKTSTSETDPDGGSTAVLLTSTASQGYLRQTDAPYQAGEDFVASVWIKRGPSHDGTSTCNIGIRDGIGITIETPFVPPTTWTRYEVTRTFDAGATAGEMRLIPDTTANGNAVYYAFAQIEPGTTATGYVKNVATVGGLVASWADQSGNGNDATQATQANMPLVQASALDSKAGALFDGVDDKLQLTSDIITSDILEAWVVVNPTTLAADRTILGGNAAGTDQFYVPSLGNINFAANGVHSVMASNGDIVAATPYLIRVQRDGSGDLLVEVNGVDKTIGTPNNANAFSFRFVGTWGASPWLGLIHEVVWYLAVLTPAERAGLLSYFSRYTTLGI